MVNILLHIYDSMITSYLHSQETRQGRDKIIGFPPNQSEYSLFAAFIFL